MGDKGIEASWAAMDWTRYIEYGLGTGVTVAILCGLAYAGKVILRYFFAEDGVLKTESKARIDTMRRLVTLEEKIAGTLLEHHHVAKDATQILKQHGMESEKAHMNIQSLIQSQTDDLDQIKRAGVAACRVLSDVARQIGPSVGLREELVEEIRKALEP